MDDIDKKIIEKLKENSRMSWQKIGKGVYLTGQAVAARVQRMEDDEVISGYTIWQEKLERHFITIFMKSNNFKGFESFLKNEKNIEHAYKITGEGCYQLTYISDEFNSLDGFLEKILIYGNYRVNSVIKCVK